MVNHVSKSNKAQTVNIRCNNAGALGTGVSGTLAAGDKLTAHWKQWTHVSLSKKPLDMFEVVHCLGVVSMKLLSRSLGWKPKSAHVLGTPLTTLRADDIHTSDL
jgi:hypothetical protein